MSVLLHFKFYDYLLLGAVSVMGTAIAYLHHPKLKALVLMLPIPFTLVMLDLRLPINASNIVAVNLMVAYTHGVRLLHQRLRLPIVPSIAISALGYILIGASLAKRVPATPAMFWWACAGTLLLAAGLTRALPPREEKGHRSPLPLAIKFPAIAGVVCLVIVIKNLLQGFTTMFPMVGVIAAYEARHSLRTVCRQIQLMVFTLTPMLTAMYLTQGKLGLHGALVVGWVVMLLVMIPLTRDIWAAKEEENERA